MVRVGSAIQWSLTWFDSTLFLWFAFLLAERCAKRQQGCMRWAMLRVYDVRLLAHVFPDAKRRGIHIQQPRLLTAIAAQAVDADRRQ